MALVTKEFKLDLAPGQLRPVVNASQGDIGRPFKADLYWNGSPWTATGYTAKLRGKKPDNTVFEYTATVSGSSVTFSTTEQMTIISGSVECELVFSNDGDVIASANFVLMVENSPYDPNAPSESVIPGIMDLIEDTIGGDVRDEVDAWLDAHPEATTTVQNGAITKAKINTSFLPFISNEYVTPEMYGAIGDGTMDDTTALSEMFGTGKKVFFPFSAKTYKTTITLSYGGAAIYGGKIKTTEALENVLTCTGNMLEIERLSIDCGNNAAKGLYCTGNDLLKVEFCTVKNTENANISNIASCAGISVRNYKNIKISHNNISNINRTKKSPGNVASVGIGVASVGTIEVSYNNIDGVKCSTETTDCDSIYITTLNTNSITNNASIIGNEIKNATGRFVKTQCLHATISNNKCVLDDTATGLNHKAFDFQYGGGVCENNYVNYGFKTSSSSIFVHADVTQNPSRNIAIKHNTIINGVLGSIFQTGSGELGGQIIIEGNKLEKTETSSYVQYPLRIGHSTLPLEIIYRNNNIGYYRLFHVDSTNNDYTNVTLIVENNNAETYTNNKLFDAAAQINNIIIRNNINMVSQLTDTVMDYTNMKAFSFMHTDASKIANLPATIGDPSSATFTVYLASVDRRICQYYESVHGNSGLITKTY